MGQAGPVLLTHAYRAPAVWWQQTEVLALLAVLGVLVPFVLVRRWRRRGLTSAAPTTPSTTPGV